MSYCAMLMFALNNTALYDPQFGQLMRWGHSLKPHNHPHGPPIAPGTPQYLHNSQVHYSPFGHSCARDRPHNSSHHGNVCRICAMPHRAPMLHGSFRHSEACQRRGCRLCRFSASDHGRHLVSGARGRRHLAQLDRQSSHREDKVCRVISKHILFP